MIDGTHNHENNGDNSKPSTKRQRPAPQVEDASQGFFSKVVSISKRAYKLLFAQRATDRTSDNINTGDSDENPAKKVKREEIQGAPIFTVPGDLLPSSILGKANNPHTALVCRRFQTMWDKVKESRFNNDRAPESRFRINDLGKNPALEKQQEEVDFWLKNRSDMWNYPGFLPKDKVAKYFDSLEAYKCIEASDTHKFLVREQILNNLNRLIIKNKILASQTTPTTLECSFYLLTRFPGEIITSLEYLAYFKALQKLDLSYSYLSALPREIGQLHALQSLDLRINQFTQLPTEIGQLTALQNLHLGYNQLTQLPIEIGQLTALQTLYLHKNHLTELPENLRENILFNLEGLSITKAEVLASQTQPIHEDSQTSAPKR